jgi:hypothetical protein
MKRVSYEDITLTGATSRVVSAKNVEAVICTPVTNEFHIEGLERN